VSTMCRRGGKW